MSRSPSHKDLSHAKRGGGADRAPGRAGARRAAGGDVGRGEGGQSAPEKSVLLDVLLTAPVFLVYHLGVVFMSVRNGLDPVTDLLLGVLHRSLLGYLGLTAGAAVVFFLVARLSGLHGKLRPVDFGLRIAESAAYAFGMWAIAQLVVQKTLSWSLPSVGLGAKEGFGPLAAIVMSFGAGFYEEVGFRVLLFGLGAMLLRRLLTGYRAYAAEIGWGLVAALAFSAIHYVGALGDKFQLGSFVFRATCGLVLTLVYRLRGFAAAVWTHALYDVGVMVF